MDKHTIGFKIRLGLFVAGGFALFLFAIFIIGRQKNLFNPVFKISTTFYSVSGLQVGNNIRFSGINVGTVDKIQIINDSTVLVKMVVDKDVQKFIKTDCEVGIGSEGIIGDRVLNITQGSSDKPSVKDGDQLSSLEPIEMDAIMSNVNNTVSNAQVISEQLSEIMFKINKGKGTLGRLIQDSSIAENINQTIKNLKKSSKGLDENMEAAKHNFLFRGYFKKKEKKAEKEKQEAEASKAAMQAEKDKNKKETGKQK